MTPKIFKYIVKAILCMFVFFLKCDGVLYLKIVLHKMYTANLTFILVEVGTFQ